MPDDDTDRILPTPVPEEVPHDVAAIAARVAHHTTMLMVHGRELSTIRRDVRQGNSSIEALRADMVGELHRLNETLGSAATQQAVQQVKVEQHDRVIWWLIAAIILGVLSTAGSAIMFVAGQQQQQQEAGAAP